MEGVEEVTVEGVEEVMVVVAVAEEIIMVLHRL